MKRKIFLLTAFLLVSLLYKVHAQDYKKMMNDPNANFYDIQKSFNDYWEKKEKQIQPAGKKDESFEGEYYQFKRWEWFMEPRLYPSGKMINIAAKTFEAWQQEKKTTSANSPLSLLGAWSSIGPGNFQAGAGWNPGIGRINCIAFDPVNASTIYVGCPAGGIWKTTVGGNSWTALSDGIPSLGISGIAINPSNVNQLFILTGDGDGGHTQSVGILRSDNGGTAWNATSLAFSVTSFVRGYKLIMDPTNPAIMFAVTTNGIYRTTDSWATNTLVLAGDFTDIEFKPGDHNIVYACNRSTFYRSLTNGSSASWGAVISASASDRLAIGVTGANSGYVYFVAGGPTGFRGLYLSTNSGASFTTQSTSPNILGYSTTGIDNIGDPLSQSSYDLTIGVDPANAATVYVGGIAVWKSTNSGVSWTAKTAWYYPSVLFGYNHADQHAFEFRGATIYTGSDGGIYSSTDGGTTFNELTNSLRNTQIYRIGGTPQNENLYIYGAQDNGSSLLNAGANTNLNIAGADGGQARIDYTNANNLYYATQLGGLLKSTNGGASFSSFAPPGATNGAWITPFIMDPVSPASFYTGYDKIYKTTNSGSSWSTVLTGAGTQQTMAMGTDNRNVVYSASTNVLRKSINGGTTWTNITGTLPVALAQISFVAVSTSDANSLYVCFSGYSSGNKVFWSGDGGVVWYNYSAGLPNIPVNCIAFQPGTANNAVYVGTDLGVYYTDDDRPDFIPFKNGLPNMPVFDFYINTDLNKITAGTFGRGAWVSDLYAYCPGTYTFTGTNTNGGYQRYTASNTITSSRSFAGGAGIDIKYNAGNGTTLQPGFTFTSTGGAIFTSVANGCPPAPPDVSPLPGEYDSNIIPYRLEAVPSISGLESNENTGIVLLEQNAPNPFTASTSIRYTLTQKFNHAYIVITANSGKRMKQVALPAGTGKGILHIDAGNLASGTYKYSLIVDGKLIATKTMVLVK